MFGQLHRGAILVLLTCLLAPLSQLAAQAQPKLPVLEASTFIVGRIDLKQADLPAMLEWLTESINQLDLPADQKQDIVKSFPQVFDRLISARQGMIDAGAPMLYFVFSETARNFEPIVYAPVAPGGNILSVRSIFRNGRVGGQVGPDPETAQPDMTVTAVLGDGVIMGRALAYKRLKEDHVGAPHLMFALNNAPAAPIQFVAAPSEDLIRFFEERLPQIPPPIDMPSATLIRTVSSAVLSVSIPPKGSARLVIQSPDVQSAMQLKALSDRLLPMLAMIKAAAPELDLQLLTTVLTPQLKEDQLVIAVDQEKLKPLMRPLATAMYSSVVQARQYAMLSVSSSNLRQILMGIIASAQQNQGTFPDKLDQLKEIPPQALANPRGGPAQPDYVYRKPTAKLADIKNPAQEILVHENLDDVPADPPMIAVGFADGHVVMYSRDSVMRMINAAPAPQK